MQQLMNIKNVTNEIKVSDDIEYLEGIAKDIINVMDVGKSLLSLIIYNIHERELYKNIVDEKGLPVFATWTEYLPHLARKLAISPATVYNYYRPAKIAMNYTTPEDYLEKEAYRVYKEIPKYVNVDKDGKTDRDVGIIVNEIVGMETGDEPLTSADIHFNLKEKLEVDETVIYYKRKGDVVIYVVEEYKAGQLTTKEEGEFLNLETLPNVVRKNITKLLYIGDTDET